jgi:hypothetical protein
MKLVLPMKDGKFLDQPGFSRSLFHAVSSFACYKLYHNNSNKQEQLQLHATGFKPCPTMLETAHRPLMDRSPDNILGPTAGRFLTHRGHDDGLHSLLHMNFRIKVIAINTFVHELLRSGYRKHVFVVYRLLILHLFIYLSIYLS